jgi:hypothetical protein
MLGRVAPVALVAVAACGGHIDTIGGAGQAPGSGVCSSPHAATPLANIGPDLQLRAACGGAARGAVASVSDVGDGAVEWSASIAGAPALQLDMSTFTSCSQGAPKIATVSFEPPLSAKPGDVFDAVVTIRAAGDAFPPGRVNVHAEVEAPVVTVDRPTIDFGDVTLGAHPVEMLVFHNETATPIIVLAPGGSPPFEYDPADKPIDPGGRSPRVVSIFGDATGEYSTVAVWTTTARPDLQLPDGCTGSIRVPLHVRLVAPDAGADAPFAVDAATDGASGNDGL